MSRLHRAPFVISARTSGRRDNLRSAIALVVLMLGLGAPAVAKAELVPAQSDEPLIYVVGFENLPSELSEGGHYLGEPIINVNPWLNSIAVETLRPQQFASEALSDANVRYAEHDAGTQLNLPVGQLPVVEAPDVDAPAPDPGALNANVAFTPGDPLWSKQWGPRQIGAPYAWDETRGDLSAAVCVVDSGVRGSHEDIGTARWLGWKDYVNGKSTPYDDHGHGSHVTGIAAATINNGTGIAGMANVGIYGVKVMDADGVASYVNVANGITWCANNTISRTVINVSIVGTATPTTELRDALKYAFNTKGKLVVSSAGNEGCGNCVTYPAKYPEAVAVSCTTGARAACDFSSSGPEVDLAAPGLEILSTYRSDHSYKYFSGTSMSAAHVSGTFALAWSWDSSKSASALREYAYDWSRDLGPPGHDSQFGHGEIDAKCTVWHRPYPVRFVEATAGPGARQITVTWDRPLYDCSSTITAYHVYRADAGGTYALIATVDGSARSYLSGGLASGATYSYRVRATNSGGTSRWSNVASATTFTKPSAPTAVTAQPGPGIGEITVGWSPPLDSGGTSITSYRIYRATSPSGAETNVASVSGSEQSWTDSGLLPGSYYYRVSAVNVVDEGPKSSRVCSEPSPPLGGAC